MRVYNMILSKLLRDSYVSKDFFNPDNKDHLKQVGYFMKYNKWKNKCPFILEWPHDSIPNMIKEKLAQNLSKLVD